MYPGPGGDITPGAYFQECPSEPQKGVYFRFLPLTHVRVLPRPVSANNGPMTENGYKFYFFIVLFIGVIPPFIPCFSMFFLPPSFLPSNNILFIRCMNYRVYIF